MICHFHSYSPEVANVLMAFQKEQSDLCVLGDRPPINGDKLVPSGSMWISETDVIRIIIAYDAAPAEIIADKKTKRWIEFQELVKQWKSERGSRSSITEAAGMRPYQEIMGMGPEAIPMIIAQLKSEGDDPDQWFWALRAITRENPVRPEDRGNFRRMAQAWFEWAEQRSYAW